MLTITVETIKHFSGVHTVLIALFSRLAVYGSESAVKYYNGQRVKYAVSVHLWHHYHQLEEAEAG
jgi:hypothetical protein